jgi:gluconolactonase
MTHVTLRGEFEDLIDPYAPVGQVGTGFQFTEGPVWHPVGHHLLFSDMPADVRRRWDPRRGVMEVRRPSHKCNGMTYDAELSLIVCEHATSSLVRERPDGRREVLASHFEGQELNSPNDVCVHSSGAIYFTDPWYGRMPVYGVERPRQLGFQGVYRVPPGGGAPRLLVDRYLFDQPNGLCFSPDERLLYVDDTVQALIRAFDVGTDGALSNPRVFASGIRSELEPGVPDGMKCDQRGNVWVTAPGGVWVYSPAAELLGKVRVPELVANLAWGGPDFRTLYVTATHSVYAIPTKVGPRHEPYMSGKRAGTVSGTGATDGSAAATARKEHDGELHLDPQRCAMIIQDLQNDVIADGARLQIGAAHARQQHVVDNVRRLAGGRAWRHCHPRLVHRRSGSARHLNAPLFEGLVDSNALYAGLGATPVSGLEPRAGDFVVEKMRMSAWEGTRLEMILKATGRDMIINTGAWTNMSVEHTARTGADKGFLMIVPEDCCSTMNAAWHNASVNFALQNVAVVTDADAVI